MSFDTVVFVIVVASRFAIPLLIPRFPLPAIVACALIDAADQSVFRQFTHVDLRGYQTYDKALDVYYLSIAYVSTLRNWVGGDLLIVGRSLWYLRLVGVALFEITGVRWLLVVFANVFEFFFIAVEFHRTRHDPARLDRRRIAAMTAFIWIVIKIPQELWLHVFRWDVTDQLKKTVLGVRIDSSWGTALTHRPWVTGGVLVVVAVAAGFLARRLRRTEDADWNFSLDADVVGEHLGWDPPSRVVRPTAAFGWSFVEKILLASMICTTFATILPSLRVGPGQMIVGTTIVIVVNTLISEALNARRITMRTLRVLYVMMVITNTATVAAFYFLLGGRDGPLRFGNTLFFVALLTLVVVLFDRYRHVGHMRREPLVILSE